jgi:hypothetical protein
VASKTIPHTIPFLMSIDETFDVGVDTRTPVDDNDYQVPFRFTGKLVKLTVNLKPAPMSAEDQKRWDEAARRVNLAAEGQNIPQEGVGAWPPPLFRIVGNWPLRRRQLPMHGLRRVASDNNFRVRDDTPGMCLG